MKGFPTENSNYKTLFPLIIISGTTLLTLVAGAASSISSNYQYVYAAAKNKTNTATDESTSDTTTTTKSTPSPRIKDVQFRPWTVATRDHEVADPCKLAGFALGMKVEGLSRKELISNLKMFTEIDGNPVSHPELSCCVENGFLLLGGGFEVLDQDGGGNMATASFPNSSFSWMARSRDEDICTPSRLRVFAIGISPNLMKPNSAGPPTSIGNVDTTFASSESLAGWACVATRRPSPGYALCGGGACAHFGMVRGETFANLQVDRNAPGV